MRMLDLQAWGLMWRVSGRRTIESTAWVMLNDGTTFIRPDISADGQQSEHTHPNHLNLFIPMAPFRPGCAL